MICLANDSQSGWSNAVISTFPTRPDYLGFTSPSFLSDQNNEGNQLSEPGEDKRDK